MTPLTLRDYIDAHIAAGRGHLPIALDRRGPQYLRDEHFDKITLSLPTDGHTHDDERVFIRASF